MGTFPDTCQARVERTVPVLKEPVKQERHELWEGHRARDGDVTLEAFLEAAATGTCEPRGMRRSP